MSVAQDSVLGAGAVQASMRTVVLQWGCPMLTTEGFSPKSMALVMPRLFTEEFGCVPLRVAGGRILYLGFEERLDASAAFALEKMSDLKVENGLVEGRQFTAARGQMLECEEVEMRLETVADRDTMAVRMTALLEQKQPISSRLVRMHQYYWMRMWLESGSLGKIGTLPVTQEEICDHIFLIDGPSNRVARLAA